MEGFQSSLFSSDGSRHLIHHLNHSFFYKVRKHCTSTLQMARCRLQNAPGYSSRRGLPSLARTKSPPSPLEIWRSSSRQVIRSQELAWLPGMGTLSGGWPEMVLPIFAAASCRGLRDCWTGDKLIFCPNSSTFSGRSMLEFISGGCSVPSLNST